MSDAFVHLHAHSYYSFLDGIPSPVQLAHAAASLGQPALALTDHHGLAGAIEFCDACQQQGVRPILGMELDVRAQPGRLDAGAGPLVLLAMNLAGWGSLCRLSTAAHAASGDAGEPSTSFEALAGDNAGLLCLTGAWRGRPLSLLRAGQADGAERWLAAMRELFSDRVYVELPACGSPDGGDNGHALNQQLAALADRLGLPVLATNNIHALAAEDAELQRLLTAMRLNTPMQRLAPDAAAPPGAHFVSGDEMQQRLPGLERAIHTAAEAAERCQLQLPLGVPHYPELVLPDGLPAADSLRAEASQGALRLYGEVTPALRERLDHELGVIVARGYAPLFLIMQQVMAFARQSGVPTSSRGSAASSLVAHCLDITSPDPLRLNLYFERFLNPARSSPPDIDTDLCSNRREGVIRHVFDEYGHDRVAMVCTVQRFRDRSALREAGKAFGLPPAEVKELAEALPYRGWGPAGSEPEYDNDDARQKWPDLPPSFAALAERYTSEQHRHLLRLAARLRGLPRHLSVHPGGVVISPGPMTDLAPVQVSSGGMPITQFDLDSISRLGLAKIDLLGIRGLTVLGDMAEALSPPAGQRTGADHTPLAALDAIPEHDVATSARLVAGRTIGCFQIESPGMRATLKEINAGSIDDLMAALALYRPGPLTGGLKDAFVRRHLGKEPVQHLHPALAPLLDDTYGVILYQEQVLRIAHELAGLSLAEADLLRRAMSHFDPGQQMQTLKLKFVAGSAVRSGVQADIAERVWELMAAFAGYGFPKAHAASYALVAWRAAWCKAHHPAQFMAGVLANWGGYYSQRVYLTEARRLGLKLSPPHVNHAQSEFSVANIGGQTRLVMGLNQVRDLTKRTQRRIQRERPFVSLPDFLSRVDPRPQEAENLARVGALEGFGPIPTLLRELISSARRPGQMSLFGIETPDEPDWPLEEKVAAQEALLGASVDAHPLELVADQIARAGALTTVAAAARLGRRVRVAGMRQTWRRTPTSRGDYMYFMSLEDLEGMLDVVIFGDVYRRNSAALASPGPFVLEGHLELDPDRVEPAIRAERVWRLE